MGVVQAVRYRYEYHFIIIGLGIMLVGFGSAAFHGTLLFEYQMADELPMIWSILVWNYSMFLLESTTVGAKHTWTAIISISYGLIYSILHVYFAFTVTFQVNFACMIGISGLILHKNCVQHTGRSFIPFVVIRGRLNSELFRNDEIYKLYVDQASEP